MRIRLLLLSAFCFPLSLMAVGSWNGVSFTAWNGVVQTAWNGTAISCASGGVDNDYTNNRIARYTGDTNGFSGNYYRNWSHGQYIDDLRLTNRNAQVTSTTGYSAGHGALDFPGTTSQGLSLFSYPFANKSNWTYMVWVKYDTTGGGGLGRFFNAEVGASINEHFFCIDPGGALGARASFDNALNQGIVSFGWSSGTWVHVAGGMSNGVFNVYTNGVYAGTPHAPILVDTANTPTEFTIGNRVADGARAWDGQKQNIELFNEWVGTNVLKWKHTNGPVINL